jgi:type I restriction enzyme R subunit
MRVSAWGCLIDGELTATGRWVVLLVPEKPMSLYEQCAIKESPTASGPAHFALCLGGHIVGIVEAEKSPLDSLKRGSAFACV